jgi:hypothetical protein
MWICRKCNVKHGDGAATCINCGGRKEDVGAVIELAESSFQRMKKRSKAKVKPLFAILAILMVPVLVYLRISEELRKEDQQLKRSEVEQAIVRVNAALDQEERKTEEKEIAGGKRQKFAYAKTLILDSAQIAMKCFSPEEMAECSSFLNKSHNKTLTDMDIIKMEALVAAKSPHMTNEETKKIKMLVKLLKSHPASLSKEQRAPLLQEIEDLYAGKTLKNRETDFSRILQGMGFEEKFGATIARLAGKYLSESERGEFAILTSKSGSLTREEKKAAKVLLHKIRGNAFKMKSSLPMLLKR